MKNIYCYSYVEDIISKEVIKKLVEERNDTIRTHVIKFHPGFPAVQRGCGGIKSKLNSFLEMAKLGQWVLILTDLDQRKCVLELIQEWFFPNFKIGDLPKEVIFRVAVREVESWVMADRKAYAHFMGIAIKNFSDIPDELEDPKQYLFSIIQKKGKKKWHKEMLPRNTAHIGPMYNEKICEFVKNKWSPKRAACASPSLQRAINALCNI